MKKELILFFTIIFISVSFQTVNAANLLFNTSFENAQMIVSGSYQPLDYIVPNGTEPGLNLTDVNGTPRSNLCDIDYNGSATWVENGTLLPPPEGINPHSGTRCIGLRSGNIIGQSSVRCEWELNRLDGSVGTPYVPGSGNPRGLNITGDFYLSVWLYLPENWNIMPANPSYSPNWYELMNPFVLWDSDMNPRTCLHIHRNSTGYYDLTLEYDNVNGGSEKISWVIFKPLDISTITGRWTHWEYFIHRSTDSNEAYMQMWLNDQLLGTFNDTNGAPTPDTRTYHLRTKGSTSTIWLTTFAKTYLQDSQNPGDGTYHYIYADDLEVWDGIPTQEDYATISGRLVNKTGSSVQATISVDSMKTDTDSNGNYSLSIPKGIYDINYSTQNIWIKLISFNLSSNQKDLVNYITKTNNKISFEINITNNQLTHVYSDSKPNNVTIGGIKATEVFSPSTLTNNTWFYNATEQKLYIIASVPGLPSADYYVIGSGGSYTAMNRSGQTILTGTNATTVINYVLSRITSGQKVSFSGDFTIDSTIAANVVNILMDFNQATVTSAANTIILYVRSSNITVFGGHWFGYSGGGSSNTAIQFSSAHDCTVDGAEMEGFVYPTGGPGNWATTIVLDYVSHNNTIKNCILHDSDSQIVFINGPTAGYNKVINCTFYNSPHSPIFVPNSAPYNEILNCEFYNFGSAGGHGIYFDGGNPSPGGNIVSGCNFHDASNDGISDKCGKNKIYNNQFTNLPLGIGIHSQYASATANDDEVYNNTFTNCVDAMWIGHGDIEFAPTNRNKIHDNTFIGCNNGISLNPRNLDNGPSTQHVDDTWIYYNKFVSCDDIFPTTDSDGAKLIANTVIAYNDFGENVTNLSIESYNNTMIYGNIGMEDFNVPINKTIPPP